MKLKLVFAFLVLLGFSCSRDSIQEKSDNTFYKMAYKYRDEGKTDSAFFYFDRARDQFIQENDSLRAANCMVNMAIISTDVGDLFGGQELALNAIPYFNESNPGHHPYLLSNYNNLGIASYNLRQYPKAIEFYTKSLDFTADSNYVLIIKNNIANANRKKGNLTTALGIYQSVLAKEKNPVNYARVLSNYTYTKWLANPTSDVASGLHKALQIRLKENDQWGQNASYAQLADYYAKKRPDSALIFSKKMYHLATNLHSVNDRLEALQKLVTLSDAQDSKKYFDSYRHLEDSVQNARDNAKNQFALIRYETEKHKAQNLVLQQKNTVRNFSILSLLILGAVAAAFFILWHNKRTKRLELEAKNALQDSQLRTSKKIHDVVANGIYRIMSEMENTEAIDQDKILDQMEVLYERSRDISYEGEVESRQDFEATIRELLLSFKTDNTAVLIFGNDGQLWECVSHEKKNELKHVLQELMVNMSKHSRASSVAVRFEKKGDHLHVYYIDNGVGIAEDTVFKNGLSNTGNRIKGIGGDITFGTGSTGGLNIQIQIPCDNINYA